MRDIDPSSQTLRRRVHQTGGDAKTLQRGCLHTAVACS